MISENGHNRPYDGVPLPPQQGIQSALPADNPSDNEGEFQIKPHQLWSAFCRRWLIGTFLGLLFAAPVMYLAWKYVPTPFRSEAEVRVLAARPRVNFALLEDSVDFKLFKSSQMKDVLHPSTLALALEEEGIAGLPTLREIPKNIEPVDWLRKNLKVESSGAEFFTIALEGENPEAIAKIVNAVKDAYLSRALSQNKLSSGDRYRRIVEELDELTASIEAKRTRIEELSKSMSAPNAAEMLLKRESLQKYIGELQKEIRSIDLSLIEINASLSTATESLPDGRFKMFLEKELDNAVKADPEYRAIAEQVRRIDRDIERFQKAYNTTDLPEIAELKGKKVTAEADLEKKFQELKTLYKVESQKEFQRNQDLSVAALEQKQKELTRLREELEAELKGLKLEDVEIAESSIRSDRLREEMEEEKALADSLQDVIQKMNIEKDAGERIEVSYDAKVPTQRETKKQLMATAGGGLAMFGLMIVLTTLLEYRYMKVNSLSFLEEEFSFPILGTIPNLPARFAHSNGNSEKSILYQNMFTEAIDAARTMLLKQQKQDGTKVIMVTSALAGEGKSTLSCHLAISFARAGRRTLLIDGDLRSPRVHEVFETNDFPGYCEALRSETPVEKCVRQLPIPRLELLPAGDLDGPTLRLLAGDRPEEIINELRERYDVIIFDASPVLPVVDSLLLLQIVDGIVLSIRKDVSRISKIGATLKKIQMLGGRLLGGVVIGIDEAEYGYRSKYLKHYQRELSRKEEAEFASSGT